ncbi:nuclear nucleic acid-binding protein C1D [Belonocnema kinseyi]|uniref:nuclear nucleic acid-binding protein C1D n=1 Tax=Belonocnema kinseyi TaxID=2817044 RepID=UPI00143D31DE|nr:nuclear nucleic acid-binding protein C1D [Belonocnema kinseyi]XP_033230122.1 nuclear nucleic acid-binding protein C1D [Belonocnema kinseyi]XP_033230123.1 nuclear nucleic acid-binding protein C1D [Belonocnema kinseyi]XP_033230124.1 nuclear nucleic acid-binding protein C1D [Belonocnema kinseyi]
MDINFDDLANDHEIIARLQQMHNSIVKIEDTLKLVNNPGLYDKLSNADKIKYNLLMSFGLNSLFWMYLRLEGIDPTKHKIKSENDRLKKAMGRAKEINDSNTKMPRLNKEVAKRFVRSGLWEPRENAESGEQEEKTWDCP